MNRYFLLYIFSTIFSLTLKAQQPSHYIIGEEDLSGVHIFSLIQDSSANVWLSTNNGLIKYDGYDFHKIESVGAKSNALFGLKKDNTGDLFCCNLSGQIFKVKNDTLQLFYEIPDSLLSNLVHFIFDNNNRLVFCTKNYYLVKANSEIKFLFPSEYSSNKIAKNKRNELIFIDFLSEQIAFYKDGKIQEQAKINFKANYPFVLKDELYISTSYNPNVYLFTNSSWEKIYFENKNILEDNLVEFRPINEFLLSFTYNNRGMSFYNENGKLKYQRSKLFPRYRISDVLNDKEGNVWLTTLGKGIIIIPNTDIVDYNNHPLLKEDDLKTITSDEEGNAYVAGSNGVIYKLKNQEVEVLKNQTSEVEFLQFHSNTNSLFVNNKLFSLKKRKEKQLKVSSIKDICVVDSTQVYIATNQGLFSASVTYQPSQIETVLLTKERTRCVAYDKKRKNIWAGTTKGLQFISDKEIKFIHHNKEHISVTDIEYINGEIWVSTNNKGILIFKGDSFLRSFSYTTENDIKAVSKIKFINSKLFFTTETGLYVYNFSTQQAKNISKTDGLLANRIKDFEVVDDKVWLLFTGGLQCISLSKITKNKIPPTIQWNGILVNNKPYSFQLGSDNEFTYQQNQFEFRFVASAFRHRGTLTYHYQLQGLNDNWQQNSYNNNVVKFSSLPHGNYTFKVKAINENDIESSILTYSFSINPPFWLTWWFYVLCALGLILIVASYFIVRLNIVRKRLTLEKQLKSSEITAIKAQMNPHFMFNALNSIQDLIMLKDIRNSNIYLGKFANLMRKILEFSSKNFITLFQELETLELYLELEKLRFGNEFEATINCKISDEKRHELQVPSMLLQPYVENAIKHGLLHKKGHKELIINFYLKNETLVCEIIDNGVGRKKSEEIKQRREKSHSSFSTEANKKRIDLIRESTNKEIYLKIIDLTENGIPTGTKVVFEFK